MDEVVTLGIDRGKAGAIDFDGHARIARLEDVLPNALSRLLAEKIDLLLEHREDGVLMARSRRITGLECRTERIASPLGRARVRAELRELIVQAAHADEVTLGARLLDHPLDSGRRLLRTRKHALGERKLLGGRRETLRRGLVLRSEHAAHERGEQKWRSEERRDGLRG